MLRTAAIALAILAAGSSQAAQLTLMDKLQLQQACRADFAAACGDQEPGEGRLAQCIRANAPKLSERCKAAIEAIRGDFLAATDTPMDY